MKRLPENFVSKGWGWESWIVNNDLYCGKLLFFKKGKKCSWHYHNIKDETFYIQSGLLKVWYSFEDEVPEDVDHEDTNNIMMSVKSGERGVVLLEPGDCFYVPPGMRHQMMGMLDTEMFEFSTKHMEEDSIRIIKGD